jgi:murein DD-endopeptidase MepM/ murein hydrolase activator NlpD
MIPGFDIVSRNYAQIPTQANRSMVVPQLPGAETSQLSAALTQDTSQRIKQSLATNTQLTQASYESLANAAQYSGVRPLSTRISAGAQLAELGAKIGEVFLKLQQDREKAKLIQAETDFFQEAQELSTKATEVIRGDTGSFGYIDSVNSLVNRYQSMGLAPESLVKGLELLYAPHNAETKRQDEQMLKDAQSLTEQTRNTQLEQAKLPLAQKLGALSSVGMSSEARQAMTNDVLTELVALSSGLDTTTGLRLYEFAYNTLNSAEFNHTKETRSLLDSVSALAAFEEENAIMLSQLSSQQISEYRYQSWYNANVLRLPQQAREYAVNASDALRQELDDAYTLMTRTQQLAGVKQPMSAEFDLGSLSRRSRAALAYKFATDPDAYSEILARYQYSGIDVGEAGEKVVMLQSIKQTADLYNRWQNESQKIKEERLKLDSSVRTLETQTFEDWWALTKSVNTVAQLDPLSLSVITQMGVAPETLPTWQPSEQEKQQLLNGWRRARDMELNALRQQSSGKARELSAMEEQLINAGLLSRAEGGAIVRNSFDASSMSALNAELGEVLNRLNSIQRQELMTGGGLQPNFNSPQLHTQQAADGTKLVFPFAPTTAFNFTPAQVYGAARGNRAHKGLDFGVPNGTEVISYISGTVTDANYQVGDSGTGYGHYVKITAPDGSDHLFAHLSSRKLKKGDTVTPGMVIGLSGESGSPGQEHLHWEVRVGGEYVNPLDYASKIPQILRQDRGAQGVQLPPGAIQAPDGWVTSDATALANVNSGAIAASTYSNRNPVPLAFASSNKADYTFGVGHNHGYQALASNPSLARAINIVARNNNIPGQWLADLLRKESNFNPRAQNTKSFASGIGQFLPSTLSDYRLTTDQVMSMSVEQQLQLIDRHLRAIRSYAGEFESPDHLVVGWFQGMGALQEYKRNPASWMDAVDATDYSVRQYLQEFGKYAGRRYNTPATRTVTHTRASAGCVRCSQMVAGAWFTAHDSLLGVG